MPPALHHVNIDCARTVVRPTSEQAERIGESEGRPRRELLLEEVGLPARFDRAEREAEPVGGSERPPRRDGTRPPAACGPSSWRCSVGRRPRRSPTRAGRRASAAGRDRGSRRRAPQYWQAQPSRANTARRVSGACCRYGTRTKCRSRTTEGASMWSRSLRKIAPLEATTSAFSLRTSTTARLAGSTASGTSVAFEDERPSHDGSLRLAAYESQACNLAPGSVRPGCLELRTGAARGVRTSGPIPFTFRRWCNASTSSAFRSSRASIRREVTHRPWRRGTMGRNHGARIRGVSVGAA